MLDSHQTEIRVRYSETDAQGVLHHANYINYYEVARVEYLRAQGGDYRQIEADGYFLVVVEFNCKYIAPAHYDDVLTITTRVSRVTPARLEHEYEVHRGEKLLATAHSVLACIDKQGRIQRVPNIIPGLPTD